MNENDVILIERYLDNGLTDSERLDVEKRLEIDSEFADLFAFLKDVKTSVAYSNKKDLRDKLAHIAEEYERQHKDDKGSADTSGRIIPFRYYAVAASLAAVIIVAAVLLFVVNDKPTIVDGKDLHFIRNYITNNPGKVERADAEILPYEMLLQFGNLPLQSIDSFKIGELPMLVIRESKYENAYFLSDTLYLFGSFDADMFLYQRKDNLSPNDTLFLKSGLTFYKLAMEKTDTISLLEKKNTNFKILPYEE